MQKTKQWFTMNGGARLEMKQFIKQFGPFIRTFDSFTPQQKQEFTRLTKSQQTTLMKHFNQGQRLESLANFDSMGDAADAFRSKYSPEFKKIVQEIVTKKNINGSWRKQLKHKLWPKWNKLKSKLMPYKPKVRIRHLQYMSMTLGCGLFCKF